MNLNKSPGMDDNHDILCAFDVIRPMLALHYSTHFRSIWIHSKWLWMMASRKLHSNRNQRQRFGFYLRRIECISFLIKYLLLACCLKNIYFFLITKFCIATIANLFLEMIQ